MSLEQKVKKVSKRQAFYEIIRGVICIFLCIGCFITCLYMISIANLEIWKIIFVGTACLFLGCFLLVYGIASIGVGIHETKYGKEYPDV